MNAPAKTLAVGLLTLVPLAGLIGITTYVLPLVSNGTISWFSMLAAGGALVVASLVLLIVLLVDIARRPGIGTSTRLGWMAALLVLLPLAAPAYWAFASVRGGGSRARP